MVNEAAQLCDARPMLTGVMRAEVTQQSKARNRGDFVVAFSPIIAEALGVAYKGAPTEIQGKLRRVVEVWADRNIFEQPIQRAIEARLQGRSNIVSLSRSCIS